MTSSPRIEVVARVIPRAGNLRFSPLSSYTMQDLLSSFLSYFLTMRPIIAGSSVPRPPRPSASPTSFSSSGTSGGVPRDRDRSPCAPVQAPIYPPPRVPMIDARHYHSLFGQRRVVPPYPRLEASEPSEEDSEEHDDTHTSSDTSHSSVDIFSVYASQGSDQESISFDSGPSSHSSFDSGSSGRWSGSTIFSGSVSSEDDLVNWHFAGMIMTYRKLGCYNSGYLPSWDVRHYCRDAFLATQFDCAMSASLDCDLVAKIQEISKSGVVTDALYVEWLNHWSSLHDVVLHEAAK
ncbi:hypothetical protein PIB30_034957 [Stylosanthes scabra]|uniref:Uncharacterized protein n=1 Tax=Stylosanthes scabra TaxID=79078 RepID=A0ABU6YDL2_9FABA|nr:hypothetical protein [Stylosanthes scabra]